MAAATDAQVQTFMDQQVRPFCEQLRSLQARAAAIKAQYDDVYGALAQQSPTWQDDRADGPPHLATPGDGLALNTVLVDFLAWAAAEGQWPVVLKLCVQPARGS